VIELLNRHFVPVFTSNEDYRDNGAAPAEERAALQRIFQEGHAKGLSVGSVHAYVVGPDGHLLSSLHTAEAAKPQKLIALLEGAVTKLGTQAGPPVLKPAPPAAPACEPGSLRLNLTARYLERKGDDYTLTEDPGGGWAAVPGTDWITIPQAAWRALVPAGIKVGDTWELPPTLTKPLLVRFYPPTENNDVSKNLIDSGSLSATMTARNGDLTTIRIDGKLRMRHDFYHKEDGRFVEATVVGFTEVDTKSMTVRSMNLVTDRAEYFDAERKHALPFGVAVKLVP
jgi:hypothetical protein